MAAARTTSLVMELLDRVTGPARRVSGALRGLGNTVRDMPTGASYTTRLDAALARNRERVESARMGVLDAVGAYYSLQAAVAAPVRDAMELESAMADVRKVVDFPTPQAFADFQRQLMDLSKQVPMTVTDLANIAAAAGQAGIAGQDLVRFTEAAAKIGTAFDISAQDAGDAMAKLMTGLDMTVDQVVSLTDAMNHLSNAQASSASEILDVVRRVGAQGKQYGFTAEQVAAFGSAMISAGANSDVAATSFMNMGRALTRGESATKRQSEAMSKLGLDAAEVARRMQVDAVGTTVDVMERIAALPKEMQAAVSSDLFGDEARALGPLLTNLGLVRESLGLVGNEAAYAGSSFKEFAVRNATFASRLQRFRNVMQALRITIGSALIPVITDLMEKIGPVIERIATFIDQHPQMVAGIISAVAALIALKGALAAIRFTGLLALSGVLPRIGAGAAYLADAAAGSVRLQRTLARMNGAPLSALGRLRAGLRGMLLAVPGVAMVGNALAAIAATVAGISAPLWGVIVAVVAAIAAAGYTAWKYWDRISAVMSGVGQAIGEILAPAFEAIRPVLDWFAPLGDIIAKSWDAAGDAIKKVGDWLGSFFQREVLTDGQKADAKQAGYDFVMAIWNGMKQVAADLIAWVQDLGAKMLAPIKEAAEQINSYLPQSTVGPEGFREDFGQPDGARAKGGPMSPGRTYLVGEQGPELVTPSRSGFVHPNGSGGGGGPISVVVNPTITINGAADPEAIMARLRRGLSDEVGAALRGVMADVQGD